MADQLLEKLQKKYATRIVNTFHSTKSFAPFTDVIKQSRKNSYATLSRSESRRFDQQWIDEIESAMLSLERIVKNPKRFIKVERNVVPIELAKRTGAESIRHLAMHSHYIKQVDKKGNIMPEKILNLSTDDEYEIYENRFIVTLIRKLTRFMELRYDYIQKHSSVNNSDVLNIKSTVTIDKVTYIYESKIKAVVPSDEAGKRQSNDDLLKRIIELRQKMMYLLSTDFMKSFKEVKPIHSPVLLTNIMKKNLDYYACYELWKFLDRYDQLGVSFLVNEVTNIIDESYIKQIQSLIGASILSINSNKIKGVRVSKKTTRKYKVKPRLYSVIRDEDLTDDKFMVFEKEKKVKLNKLSFAQEAAIKKRKELAEKQRQKRLQEQLLKKEKEQVKKMHEKERAKKVEAERKVAALEKRRKEQERKRILAQKTEADRIEQLKRKIERDRLAAIRREEQEKLVKIRKQLRQEALQNKEKQP